VDHGIEALERGRVHMTFIRAPTNFVSRRRGADDAANAMPGAFKEACKSSSNEAR